MHFCVKYGTIVVNDNIKGCLCMRYVIDNGFTYSQQNFAVFNDTLQISERLLQYAEKNGQKL